MTRSLWSDDLKWTTHLATAIWNSDDMRMAAEKQKPMAYAYRAARFAVGVMQ